MQEALALLEELSNDEDFQNADIFITPPSNEITDENCGPSDLVDVNNFSGVQLSAETIIAIESTNAGKKILCNE